MTSFEYVTVLISIVLGLGITQILTGVAKLIQRRERVRLYWPHLLWILFILFLHIQEWWVMYELKGYQPWRLPVFLFIMLYPINLFVMARLLFPDKMSGKKIDLKTYYYDNYRSIFALLVVSAILSIVYNVYILRLTIKDQFLQILLAVIFTLVALRNYSNKRLHQVLSLAVVIIMIITVIVEWDVWLVG
ncbi:MAG: hypothetical protein JST43_14760 [Bacteroidetes bacterium]|nr:hypothetical protein [Bacteroidota bacterium]MBS1540407.1 hypothetical protein [Bacteroidota bacterium]